MYRTHPPYPGPSQQHLECYFLADSALRWKSARTPWLEVRGWLSATWRGVARSCGEDGEYRSTVWCDQASVNECRPVPSTYGRNRSSMMRAAMRVLLLALSVCACSVQSRPTATSKSTLSTERMAKPVAGAHVLVFHGGSADEVKHLKYPSSFGPIRTALECCRVIRCFGCVSRWTGTVPVYLTREAESTLSQRFGTRAWSLQTSAVRSPERRVQAHCTFSCAMKPFSRRCGTERIDALRQKVSEEEGKGTWNAALTSPRMNSSSRCSDAA